MAGVELSLQAQEWGPGVSFLTKWWQMVLGVSIWPQSQRSELQSMWFKTHKPMVGLPVHFGGLEWDDL